MIQDAAKLQSYAHTAGLDWKVQALRNGNVRVVDSSDDDFTHDVVMTYTEAVELFEDMTDVAVL
jgi:hypothetical protein